MNGWDYRLALTAGITALASALAIGIPAVTHHGTVPHVMWLTGMGLGVSGIALMLASFVASIVIHIRDRKRR